MVGGPGTLGSLDVVDRRKYAVTPLPNSALDNPNPKHYTLTSNPIANANIDNCITLNDNPISKP